MNKHRAVVIGGGLAGLAAAIDLCGSGADITLLEARPRLGGATFSFRRGDLVVDNGQHVFLRCYTAYRDFLDRIGATSGVQIQRRFDVPVLLPSGRTARLYRTRGLPAPLHLAPSLLRYSALPVRHRLRLLEAAAKLRGLDETDPDTDLRTFGGWLDAQRQPASNVAAVWDLLINAALNIGAEHASLALSAKVLKTALLTDADAADIGVPTVPLQELHGEPAARHLRRNGAKVLCGTRVHQIRPLEHGYEVLAAGQVFPADLVVLAVPHYRLAQLLPQQQPVTLDSAPIVNLHLVLDRRVLDRRFAAVVGPTPLWLFDRSDAAGASEGHQYLTASISAADEQINQPVAELRRDFLPVLAAALPTMGSARLVDFFVTREPQATFRQDAGSGAARLAARTRHPGVFLAGAWTATGWPDTMEGAVRSGYAAAREGSAFLSSRAPQSVAKER